MNDELLKEVKGFIVDFKRDHDGLSPSYRTMARALKQSVGMIQRCIDALVEEGTLVRGPRSGLMIDGGQWTFWGK